MINHQRGVIVEATRIPVPNGAPLTISPSSTEMKGVPNKYQNKVELPIHEATHFFPARHNKLNGNCTNNGAVGHFLFCAGV